MKQAIPEESLKKHLAILGMNGSGKTSTAKAEVIEPALEANERVCNIDPTGVGWGLRLSASGKSKAYPIYIVGGERGDFPLHARDGKAWAEIVGTSSDSFVFDTSLMTVEDRSTWWTAFAETLLRKNKGPLRLVIDEIHLFAPQGGSKAGGIAPKMLHATNNLLALGRSRGLRITMISQRPAKLHKDSLTQAHTLVAMQFTSPQDRKAIAEWIADQADVEKGKEIIASLPNLATGEGWIWAPKEKILERVKFKRPRTFDSSTAPDIDDTDGPTLAAINPDAIKAKLENVAKETVANDPAKLKARIAELERAASKARAGVDPRKIKDADADGYSRGLNVGYEKGWKAGYPNGFVDGFAKCIDHAKTTLGTIPLPRAIAVVVPDPLGGFEAPKKSGLQTASAVNTPIRQHAVRPSSVSPSTSAGRGDGTYSVPQVKILRSLAMWRALGHATPSRPMVAAAAGYSPSSGGFNNLIGGLNTAGAIRIPQQGHIELLADGIDMGIDEGRSMFLSNLSGPQQKLVGAVKEHGGPMTREQLGSATDYQPTSGGFNNLIGSLSTLNVFVKPQPGSVDLSDWARELL